MAVRIVCDRCGSEKEVKRVTVNIQSVPTSIASLVVPTSPTVCDLCAACREGVLKATRPVPPCEAP